jgi:hypothetical protein
VRVKKPHLALIHFIGCIHLLHEMKDIILLMTIRRNCRAYGNNFTQWFSTIRVIKNAMVQQVEMMFMRRLF